MWRRFGIALALALGGGSGEIRAMTGWSFYGGDPGGTRYSSLAQIDRANVGQLQVAWTYRTGELGEGFATRDKLAFEATPILVDGRLYLSTPTDQVVALDPASGRELWRYDPQIDRSRRYAEATSRGVSAWHDPDVGPDGALRAPDLHRHAGRPADRARWCERAALRGLRRWRRRRPRAGTCGRPSPASTRSPRRPRSRAIW